MGIESRGSHEPRKRMSEKGGSPEVGRSLESKEERKFSVVDDLSVGEHMMVVGFSPKDHRIMKLGDPTYLEDTIDTAENGAGEPAQRAVSLLQNRVESLIADARSGDKAAREKLFNPDKKSAESVTRERPLTQLRAEGSAEGKTRGQLSGLDRAQMTTLNLLDYHGKVVPTEPTITADGTESWPEEIHLAIVKDNKTVPPAQLSEVLQSKDYQDTFGLVKEQYSKMGTVDAPTNDPTTIHLKPTLEKNFDLTAAPEGSDYNFVVKLKPPQA